MAQFNALCGKYLDRLDRDDYRAGMICATLANIHRGPKSKPWLPDDFFRPRRGAQKSRAQSPDEMLAMAKAWNAALGGEVVEE